MFLSLEFPSREKQISLMARDLSHDNGYQAWMKPLDTDSERGRVDRAIELVNRQLGDGRNKLINMIFNQFNWEGTTGWEYWTKDYDKVLLHAIVVSDALDVPLHVHKSFDEHLLKAAEDAGITLEFVTAVYSVQNSNARDAQVQARVDNGEYIRLTKVTLPKGTPIVELH